MTGSREEDGDGGVSEAGKKKAGAKGEEISRRRKRKK